MMLTRLTAQRHHYNIKLTREELLMIANDGISDFFYTNKMLDLIKKEAKRIDELTRKSGKEDSADRG